MKTHNILLCLMLGNNLAFAATPKTSTSADKPDRLCLENYTVDASGTIFRFDHDYDLNGNSVGSAWEDRSSTLSGGWTNGVGGTASWDWKDVFGSYPPGTASTNYAWVDSIYDPDGLETIIDASDDDLDSGFAISQEHCDLGVPVVDNTGSYTYPYDASIGKSDHVDIIQFGTRHAQAGMTLQTGGRSGSKLQNLFGFNGSATRMVCSKLPPPFSSFNNPPPPVPPISRDAIYINNVGYLPATGTKYKVLPDDATLDVTPQVKGVDYFTFSEGEQKYKSYFDLYVEQASPGYSFLPYGPNYVGHASWSFRTEAPSDALQYISTNLTAYLNHSWGFFPGPSGSICSSAPGQLKSDNANSGSNIHRRFYIGFSGLLNGLLVTRGMDLSPPAYCVTGFNCVSGARYAGFAAGVFGLPADQTPQNFGITLIQMYPPILSSDPFDDEADIFYSSAPY